MDVKSILEILGHKAPSITIIRYSHSLLDYKIEMMNKLGKILINNIKKTAISNSIKDITVF